MLGSGFLVAIALVVGGEVTANPPTPRSSIERPAQPPEVAGIGVALRVKEGRCYVVRVLKETPAAAEGSLRARDQVVAVAEGEAAPVSVDGMKLGEVAALIRGRVGTEVRLTIVPADNEAQRVVRLVRGSIDQLLRFGQEPLPLGSPAPPADFHSLGSEETFTLASLAGEKVVLKFWSTGCGPCLKALDNAYGPSSAPAEGNQGDRVLLVSIDDDIETSRRTFASRGWTGSGFVWGGYEVSKQFQLPGLPCTVVIDADGRIEACVMGTEYDLPVNPD